MQSVLVTKPKQQVDFGKSASSYTWQLAAVDDRLALTLSQKFSLPDIVARILSSKEIALDEVENFLRPSLKNSLPDPDHLLDMSVAAARLASAVTNQEKIAVFGDYDVDGATSSALLKRFFAMVGLAIRIYIPDRIAEGYGPNAGAMQQLRGEGADIVITVDCGTVSYEPIKAAKEAGLEVIVIDHHLGNDILPEALAVVNPNRLDETSPHKHMAAVGVSFLLIVAINRVLREQGFYQNRQEPDLLSLLDVVALGTVCDVMPLTGINRAFVAQGLKVMAKRQNKGLVALSDVASIKEAPGVYHLGFVLGPRINAGGRVGESSLGATLLSTQDAEEAHHIAGRLDHFNAERKAIETLVLEEAIAQAETAGMAKDPMIIVQSEGWHPGVIGIVAGRLKERYNRPVAVISLENGIGKASARSITGVDLGAAIIAAKAAEHLVAGGGHAMAAGFTIEEHKIPVFHTFLKEQLAKAVARFGAIKALEIQGIISLPALTPALVGYLSMLGPFGVGNPEPRFAVMQAQLVKVDRVGQDHLRCILRDGSIPTGGATVTAMAFRSTDTTLGQVLQTSQGKRLNVVGKIRLNVWQGRESVQFLVDDVGC